MAKQNFKDTNIGKTAIASLYIAASAIVGYLISATAGDPELFGPLTALVNVLLVFVKKTFFESKTQNLGGN